MKLRKVFSICLSVLFLAVLLAGCSKDEEANIRNARNGVVRVLALSYSGSQLSSAATGTAFGVGIQGEDADTFVTNRHVVTDDDGDICSEIYLLLSSDAMALEYKIGDDGETHFSGLVPGENFEKEMIPCEVLYVADQYPDVAIIRAKTSVSGIKALPLQKSEEAKEAQQVYTLGYPGVMDDDTLEYKQGDVITIRYLAGVKDVVTDRGTLSRFTTLAWADNTKAISHLAHINHGNSGGPLLTGDGAVIGINTYFSAEDGAYASSIYIDYAMEALDELNIPYDRYTGGGIFGIPVYLAVAAAAAVILLALVVVLAAKRRNSAGMKEKGKNRKPDPPEPPGPGSGGKAQVSFTLYGLGGEMQGCSWSLGNEPVTMGREADCTVRFKPDTQGVSRHHCQIVISNGTPVLRDMNSRYGTYLNGIRLTSGNPAALKPGDRFWPGNEKYIFTIK